MLDTLAEIRERRDAVMELEKSLMELHQARVDPTGHCFGDSLGARWALAGIFTPHPAP